MGAAPAVGGGVGVGIALGVALGTALGVAGGTAPGVAVAAGDGWSALRFCAVPRRLWGGVDSAAASGLAWNRPISLASISAPVRAPPTRRTTTCRNYQRQLACVQSLRGPPEPPWLSGPSGQPRHRTFRTARRLGQLADPGRRGWASAPRARARLPLQGTQRCDHTGAISAPDHARCHGRPRTPQSAAGSRDGRPSETCGQRSLRSPKSRAMREVRTRHGRIRRPDSPGDAPGRRGRRFRAWVRLW